MNEENNDKISENFFLFKLKFSQPVTMQSSVVQPIRHSPHVANGHLNEANCSFTKYFKIPTFKTKLRF